MQTFDEYKVSAQKKGGGGPSKEQVYNDAIEMTIKEISKALGMSEAALKAMIKG